MQQESRKWKGPHQDDAYTVPFLSNAITLWHELPRVQVPVLYRNVRGTSGRAVYTVQCRTHIVQSYRTCVQIMRTGSIHCSICHKILAWCAHNSMFVANATRVSARASYGSRATALPMRATYRLHRSFGGSGGCAVTASSTSWRGLASRSERGHPLRPEGGVGALMKGFAPQVHACRGDIDSSVDQGPASEPAPHAVDATKSDFGRAFGATTGPTPSEFRNDQAALPLNIKRALQPAEPPLQERGWARGESLYLG